MPLTKRRFLEHPALFQRVGERCNSGAHGQPDQRPQPGTADPVARRMRCFTRTASLASSVVQPPFRKSLGRTGHIWSASYCKTPTLCDRAGFDSLSFTTLLQVYSPGFCNILRTSPRCISSSDIKRRAYSSSITCRPLTSSSKLWYSDKASISCSSDSFRISPIS